KKRLVQSIGLFQEYHGRFPSHGYRWLNAKIRLDKGIVFSDPYAHKCCKIAGIKSLCKHYSYKKEGDPSRTYPNLLLAGINITGPMECVVSDMTAFYVERTYYELTLYMDLWNDELIAHALSSKRGDRMTYLDGLQDVLAFKKQYPNQKLILHSDQGSVYASKSYNELLPMYNIVRSMSRAGTPTDNAAMEAINGWIKAELFTDFHITSPENVPAQVSDYIRFFNAERPAYALGYLTPKQYREQFAPKHEGAAP
ncbi:MAG: DDE-type integrase/transposase/recombinase, partial [Selenomonas sp.]|nr:DDE-type integrase/transposase/recombinase [Selenomonas sp.]